MQEHKRVVEKDAPLRKDDLIVITGAGGFIAGNLTLYFERKGFTNIRAVDKKPLYEWYLHVPGVESLCLDVSNEDNCKRVCEGAVEVYNLAADMGGMGFIERFRVELISEQFCEEHWHERGLKTFIARFHNVYGPYGTWDGGREKAPAAIWRKVIEGIARKDLSLNIWGNGEQTRSFMYIDDCVKGIDLIMHCDSLIATPINLGSSEMVSINTLVSKVERIAGVRMKRSYDLSAPQGVAGRNSDNTFIKKVLQWEPNTSLDKGLAVTYKWIKAQYDRRSKGHRVGLG